MPLISRLFSVCVFAKSSVCPSAAVGSGVCSLHLSKGRTVLSVLLSRQSPRRQSPPLVCASRPSCPQVLGGPTSIRFPVLRAEIPSSARRAKTLVNPMFRIIPGTLRDTVLCALGPMLHTSPGIRSSFRPLTNTPLPRLSERVGFHLRPPCAALLFPLRSCQAAAGVSGRVVPSFS